MQEIRERYTVYGIGSTGKEKGERHSIVFCFWWMEFNNGIEADQLK